MKAFDYNALPFEDLAERYRRGASWRELARLYECPDHKTLKEHVTRRFPELDVRNHAEAQRARREREGSGRKRSATGKAAKRPSWWPS